MNLKKRLQRFNYLISRIDRWNNRLKRFRNWLLLKSLKGHCAYCGMGLTKKTITADHVIPISELQAGRLTPLFPACGNCNTRKGSMSIKQFRKRILWPGHQFFFEDGVVKEFDGLHRKIQTPHGLNPVYKTWREKMIVLGIIKE